MSVEGLRAAMAGVLGEGVTAVFDAPPVRAACPYAVVGEAVAADWSTKDAEGVEARIAVELHDAGESAGRVRALAEAARGAVMGLPPELPPDVAGGWWIVSLAFVRQRVVRTRERWVASIEFRARMLRSN